MNKCPTISINSGGTGAYIDAGREELFFSVVAPSGLPDLVDWLRTSEDSPFNRLPEAVKLADILTADIQFLEDTVADLEERLKDAQAMLGRVVLGEVVVADCEAVMTEED